MLFTRYITVSIMAIFMLSMQSAYSTTADTSLKGKKILYIDSYHEGYVWSDGVTQGIRDGLKGTGVELKVFRMDTKRNRDEEFKQASALKAKALIESYKPDIVIASDDNASKYLIVPHFKNSDLPFVFCGLNEELSVYGYPFKNTTGMVEQHLVKPVIHQLSLQAKGKRLGFLGSNTLTSRKSQQSYTDKQQITFDKVYFATDFDDWKSAFIKIQTEVDILILNGPRHIINWDEKQAIEFVQQNTKIPTGAVASWVMPFAMLGIVLVPEGHGQWAASSALKILRGAEPNSIPIHHDTDGKLMLNMKISQQLDLTFTMQQLRIAELLR